MKTGALQKHLVFQGEKAYQRFKSTGRARNIRTHYIRSFLQRLRFCLMEGGICL